MVSYQAFTRLAFQVAKSKGARFSGIEEGGQFTSQIAGLWREDKGRLKQMTEAQARSYLDERVSA